MKTNDKILHLLKREGATTAKSIAERFELTTMGIRLQLQALEQQGLVEYFDVKVKVGRPQRHWQLSQQGHNQFSDHHDDLLIQTFDAVENLFGHDGLTRVIKEREQQSLLHYQAHIPADATLAEKLKLFSALRDQEGYITELIPQENGFLFVENHCPICQAATRCPNLCQSELSILTQVLGKQYQIERSEHIVAGQRRCAYWIYPMS
ncbi:helix-turn-helix transcriptional regulator [Photobacterium damselae]|uniref:helix-turn-helix transcriptional regulator n=1 Tax=Photobacterium damselae TaxID=38293 RepID=UPI00390780DB